MPFQLEEIIGARFQPGFKKMTVGEVRGFMGGFSRRKREAEICRGSHDAVDFPPEIKVAAMMVDGLANRAVDGIVKAAGGGRIGQRRVSPIEDAGGLRAEERREHAV